MACIQTPLDSLSSLTVLSGTEVVYKYHSADCGLEELSVHCSINVTLNITLFSYKRMSYTWQLSQTPRTWLNHLPLGFNQVWISVTTFLVVLKCISVVNLLLFALFLIRILLVSGSGFVLVNYANKESPRFLLIEKRNRESQCFFLF